jgi:transcriptional regulator with XRE-family HTH domain
MAAERKTGDVGSRLRDARERKGVSLRAIADITRISVAALEALERNDISRLPGGIFSRAFVRAYASQVGLDPEATVEEFIRQFPHETVTAGHPPSTRVDDADSFENDRRVASLGVKLAGLSLPIIALVIYFGMAGRHAAPGNALAPQTTAARTDLSATPGSGATDRVERLNVEVIGNSPCRISASVDGQVLPDVVLDAAGRHTFNVQRDLVLTVSDAGAVTWTINGAPSRALGASDGPATIHLTLDNFREYLSVP